MIIQSFRELPCFINSILGDLDDLLEDFSDFEEEFLLEAPVIEWVEFAESNRFDLLFNNPFCSGSSSSSPWDEQEPDLLRLRRLLLNSRPRDS